MNASTATALQATVKSRSRPRRDRRLWLVASLLPAIVVLAAGAGISWYFSSKIVVPERPPWPTNATVKALPPGAVTLSRSKATLRPGVYGLEWPSGHAIVEGVLSANTSTVTRRLRALQGHLVSGTKVDFDANVYQGNPRQALGLAYTNVNVPDELGPMPAWLIPARSRTWAIIVHGINGNREDDLRIAPILHAAELPSLLITYRQDVGSPSSPDGHHHMGQTEWRDLQAAAGYAMSHGAQRLVLVGYSMGGAVVSQFMERSMLAHDVAGLILDAPALDWKAIISLNAKEMGLPSFLSNPVEWAIDLRIKPNWSSLDALNHPGDFHLPILLFHGLEDEIVPISSSDAFARELPSWVSYYRVPYAGHIESWNIDPALYAQRVSAFLAGKLRLSSGVGTRPM